MRIKRTFAPTMRDALLMVKQEQGPDAVILGNKKVPGGIEILSAIDFDEAAMMSAAPNASPARIPAPAVSVSDVANDAWVGSMFNDGRKEPTLGPVAGNRGAGAAETIAPRQSDPIRLPRQMPSESVTRSKAARVQTAAASPKRVARKAAPQQRVKTAVAIRNRHPQYARRRSSR